MNAEKYDFLLLQTNWLKIAGNFPISGNAATVLRFSTHLNYLQEIFHHQIITIPFCLFICLFAFFHCRIFKSI